MDGKPTPGLSPSVATAAATEGRSDTEGGASLSDDWRRWMAESSMLRMGDDAILQVLRQGAIPERAGIEALAALPEEPCYVAGDWIAQRFRKLASLLDVYSSLAALSARHGVVERRAGLSRETFLEEFYAANRPVVLLNMFRNAKLLSAWTPAYLRDSCGDEMVEIMSGRSADPRYELNSPQHKTMISFADYVDMVMASEGSNDVYLVANNHFLEREGTKHLYRDCEPLPDMLDRDAMPCRTFLWFGPAGTITPLHHDLMNILLLQVYGRKRVTLISPNDTPRVYNDISVFSDVDCEYPDYVRHPAFRDVKSIVVDVGPGEALFLPVGWWHHVRALDTSITLTFSNFVYPNSYAWNNPSIHR